MLKNPCNSIYPWLDLATRSEKVGTPSSKMPSLHLLKSQHRLGTWLFGLGGQCMVTLLSLYSQFVTCGVFVVGNRFQKNPLPNKKNNIIISLSGEMRQYN